MLYHSPADPLSSPFQLLHELQSEFALLLGEAQLDRPSRQAFTLVRREDGLLLRALLPGVDAKDVALEADGSTLTISAKFPGEPEDESAVQQRIERPRGSFSRTLQLDFDIDAARVQARLERGVLEVELPRLAKNPPVKIQVLPEERRN